MSQQIIEVLEYLFEKFGIAVDWTAANIMPYVQQLAEKITTYNIVYSALNVVVTGLLLIGCCIYARILYGSYKRCYTTEKDTVLFVANTNWHDEYTGCEMNLTAMISSAVAITVAIVCAVLFGIFVDCLLRWIFIPELQLVDYIADLVNNVQM